MIFRIEYRIALERTGDLAAGAYVENSRACGPHPYRPIGSYSTRDFHHNVDVDRRVALLLNCGICCPTLQSTVMKITCPDHHEPTLCFVAVDTDQRLQYLHSSSLHPT